MKISARGKQKSYFYDNLYKENSTFFSELVNFFKTLRRKIFYDDNPVVSSTLCTIFPILLTYLSKWHSEAL